MSQFEPQSLDYDNTIYGTVCAVGCDEGLEDPTDIFVIGGWKGDVIDLEFSSNEGDVNPDYGVHVYIKFETQFFSSNQVIYYKLDDSCDISNDGDCRVTLSYQFEQSGDLYVSFYSTQGDDTVADEEIEDYWIYNSYSDSLRDEDADLDGDGLPDYMEYLCLSDFRDATDTADNDADKVCDDVDFDDDNDGYDDIDEDVLCIGDGGDSFDFTRTPADNDMDMECDYLDLDDDNDGYSDLDEDVLCIGDGGDSFDFTRTPADNDMDMECDYLDLDDDNDGYSDLDEDVLCIDDGGDSLDSARIPADNDIDMECDYLDLDDDNDGYDDESEIDCNSDGFNALEIPKDFDFDTVCDYMDSDIDDDGIDNIADGCNYTSFSLITMELDLDSDGCFTSQDTDWDGDGILNVDDLCPMELSSPNRVNATGCIVPSFAEVAASYAITSILVILFFYASAVLVLIIARYRKATEFERRSYSHGKAVTESIKKINNFMFVILARMFHKIRSFFQSVREYYLANIKKKGKCIGCDEVQRVLVWRPHGISELSYPLSKMLPNDSMWRHAKEAPICKSTQAE